MTNTSSSRAGPFELAALSRTILLARDHLREEVTDAEIAHALLSCRVGIAADSRTLESVGAQHFVVSTALLCARSGAQVECMLPPTALLGVAAPIRGDDLGASIIEALSNLVRTGSEHCPRAPLDLLIVIGHPSELPHAARTIWAGATNWAGWSQETAVPCDWTGVTAPFGPLAAAGICAGEAFKIAMRGLSEFALRPDLFREFFANGLDGRVTLAADDTPVPATALGRMDFISGGAISQSVLYVLARIPHVSGDIRLIEPESSDETNLNRYALLLRSDVGRNKADALATLAADGRLGGLTIQGEPVRYDEATVRLFAPLRPHVVVGVDHIPTRWLVQRQWPSWLAVGATTHYDAMASIHRPDDEGCAGCAHPIDDTIEGPLPTAALVTHWAGLFLAAYLARKISGFEISEGEQLTYGFPLQITNTAGIWRSPVARNPRCPVHSVQTSRESPGTSP
jgi:hypothetical protein